MKTLYLRNVPDVVVERLEALSSEAGMSVSAYAVQQLASRSAALHNKGLLETLPRIEVEREDILQALGEGRDRG